ncbi:unnamed protein product [Phytophthora fragariaefolia]|uniref:Unnamed protein product n=1 Tax=Phytophthora fragariaefolia TaxID=1490495 RepID=A0A9W6YJ00_9STRA|nr:unnamed protein product [Phytophthora fragariaefolia]
MDDVLSLQQCVQTLNWPLLWTNITITPLAAKPPTLQWVSSEPRYTKNIASRRADFARTSRRQTGLWKDGIITAMRIPRDKLYIEQFLNRGAFGDINAGVYSGKQVAIKLLLPQMCGEIRQVNAFLNEAKMTATMEHPHVMTFVGVAWDSLSYVRLNGVLKRRQSSSVTQQYESTNHTVGFDRFKFTIALHGCHGL